MKNIMLLLLIASHASVAGDAQGSGTQPQSIVVQENENYFTLCTINSDNLLVDCITVTKEGTGTGS